MASDNPVLTTVGLIGFPLGHSVSPAMHNAAFRHLGLPWRYQAWETPPEALAARVAGLRASALAGANVTVPHKSAVIPFLDEVAADAKGVGAVNTIVNRAGRLLGYNTDGEGFLRALRDDAGFAPKGRAILILGAGGAARAVISALASLEPAVVTVANRDAGRAHSLARSVAPLGIASLRVVPWEPDSLVAAAERSDLIVNTTTVGMHGGPAAGTSPIPEAGLREGQLVFDLVYNPLDTPLAVAARARGARALTGLPMLVYQGAAAFTLWTGLPAPVTVMRAAAEEALKGE